MHRLREKTWARVGRLAPNITLLPQVCEQKGTAAMTADGSVTLHSGQRRLAIRLFWTPRSVRALQTHQV